VWHPRWIAVAYIDPILEGIRPLIHGTVLDVGCGARPHESRLARDATRYVGIDRPGPGPARPDVVGDAMALPVADRSVDAATMALVIFFVPDPAKGVAEMRRVVRPGGVVAAYAWDFTTGGFPWQLPQDEVRATGATVPWPPQAEIVRIDRLHQLWADAGLQSVASREIVVERVFPSFDEFWRVAMLTPVLGALVEALPSDALAGVKERVRAALRIEGGKVVHTGKANAVKGVVPR